MRDLLCMMRKRRHKHVLLHQCASCYIELCRSHHTSINMLLAVHRYMCLHCISTLTVVYALSASLL